MLRKIAIFVGIGRACHANRRGDAAARFVGGHFGDHGKDDFTGLQELQTFFTFNNFAAGGEDRGDTHEIEVGNPRFT